MDRPKRAPKPVERYTPSRTLNLDIPKVEVKDSVIQDILDKPKVTTRKTKAGVQRTLHLDLSDVPPSDDEKFSKDWSQNEFWFKNFYTPKDKTTKLFMLKLLKSSSSYPLILCIILKLKKAMVLLI
jgi:hypothetical protein